MSDPEMDTHVAEVVEALRILGPATTGELTQAIGAAAPVLAVVLVTAEHEGRVVAVRDGPPWGWLWSLPPQAGWSA